MGMTDALLVLIPKTEQPKSIRQFFPISLCNVTFKLVTKVLVNRLKMIMEHIVSPNQSSFVPHQQTTDNITVCHELIDALKRKSGARGGMIIKIDLEKAYDGLEWSFIKETLIDVGLPQPMVNVIMKCVTRASFRLVWNKDCTESMQQLRGIRQGDLISPYVFVLCLERLAQQIQKEVDIGN